MAQFEDIDFPGWEVVRKIGEGSFGGVYEIHRTLPGGRVEKCALKKLAVPKDASEIQDLYSQSFSRESITAHYQDQMSELVNEYSLTQELNSCKNVVACHDVKCVQHDDGIGWDIYIRMELLRPLKQVLGAEYRERVVLRLGLEMCNALLACQEHSIIHRDIKPENILVSEKGEFKLGDFGIAKVSEKTATGTMTGTMGYMAPEVANRWHYGAQADIYSLGMVLYWMMNLRTLPFLPYPPSIPTAIQRQEAANRRFAGEAFPPPVNGSRELKAIVMKACAFSTEKRYQSVRELRRELYLCYQQHTGRAPEPAVMMPTAAPIPDEPSQRSTVGAFGSIRGDKDASVNTSRSGRFAAPPEENSKKRVTAVTCVFAVLFLCFAIAAGYLLAHQTDLTPGTVLAPKTANRMRSDYMDIIQVSNPEIERTDVASITFLDTVKDAPENSWDISEKENGSVLAWVTGQAPEYDLYIAGEGGVQAPEDCDFLFSEYSNVNSIDFGAAFDTSKVTDMACMFWNCWNLNNLDVGSFDTSYVTDMSSMFASCRKLDNLDLSNFDTSRVTNMSHMFWDCANLNNLDVGSFDTSHVTDMSFMFACCEELGGIDLSNFDFSSAIDCEDFMNEGRLYNGRPWLQIFPQELQEKEKDYQPIRALMDEGKYMQAMWAFGALNYQDSQEKMQEARSIYMSSLHCPTLSAGGYHTVGIRSDGTVIVSDLPSYDSNGQDDVDSWTDIVAVAAGGYHTVGLRNDGTVVATGENELGECDVDGWTDIVAVSAGVSYTVGLRSDGTVVATGWNDGDQCNVDSWSDIVAVSAGVFYTVGLRDDGTVVATGLNDDGQCNVGSWSDIVAVSAGGMYTVGLRSDGTVVATGLNDGGQCNVDNWSDIVAVSAGGSHTVGLRSDGTVVATGWNNKGQCDVGSWSDIVAVSAGNAHTVGLRSDGTVVATGWNDADQCDVSSWRNIATS